MPNFYLFLRYQKLNISRKLRNYNRRRNYAKVAIGLFDSNVLNDPVCKKKPVPQGGSLIEITNACNLNCRMCNTKASKRQIGFIEPDIFDHILQQLSTVGIKIIGLHTVGEPFMYKGLEQLLEIAQKRNFLVWISTNGQFPQRIKQLFKSFPDLANWYRFSIDGASQKTYEFIRRGASFDRLMESLEVIHEINNRKIGYRVNLSIDSMVSMSNIYEIPLFFKVFKKYCWSEDIRLNLINGLSPDSTFFRKDFPFPKLIRKSIPCSMPFKNVYFTYEGKVTLCCRDYEEELVVGDILKDNLTKIWNNRASESVREKHLNPDKMDINACRSCFGPHKFVPEILNEYVHFLINNKPSLTDRQFGDQLLLFLNNINSAIENKNMDQFKSQTLGAFI